MKKYQGIVKTKKLISLRFSQGGVLGFIKVEKGYRVKKGQVLAGLNKKMLEMQLEIELADYRKIRAEFDKLSRDIPSPNTDDEKTRKEIAQANLDRAVKSVEKIKYDLDQLNLVSPVNGIILETSGLCAGMQISPSGYPIEVADWDDLVMEIKVKQEEIKEFEEKPEMKMKIGTWKGEAKMLTIGMQNEGKTNEYAVEFEINKEIKDWVRLGYEGVIEKD